MCMEAWKDHKGIKRVRQMIVEESTEPAGTGQLLGLIQLMPCSDPAQSSKKAPVIRQNRA